MPTIYGSLEAGRYSTSPLILGEKIRVDSERIKRLAQFKSANQTVVHKQISCGRGMEFYLAKGYLRRGRPVPKSGDVRIPGAIPVRLRLFRVV